MGQERLGGVLLPPNKNRPAEDSPQREGSGEGGGGIKIGFKEASPAIPSCLELPKWPKANTSSSLPSAV